MASKAMQEFGSHHLKSVEVTGLWGRSATIRWELNPDINILFGENGTGKSTLLKLIAAALSPKFPLRRLVEYSSVEICRPSDFFEVIYGPLDLYERIKGELSKGSSSDVQVDFIDTFDNFPSEKSDLRQSSLDLELDQVTRRYLAWQSSQSNLVFSKKQDFETAFEKKTFLIETLDRLFAPTQKRVNTDEAELEFLFDNRQRIRRDQLSSGEKQLLVLLLTALCQSGQPAILLLDEPEISLHLRWQHELVGILRRLNPECQLIIATHSPSIFNDGLRDRVFWMEDLWQGEKTGVAV